MKCISKRKYKWFRTILIDVGRKIRLFLIIANLTSTWLPNASTFPTAHVRPHPPLEQRVNLFKSINPKHNSAFALIFHAEIEPLPMSLSVGVHTHVQIILKISRPDIMLRILKSPDWGFHPQTDYWIRYHGGCEDHVCVREFATSPVSVTDANKCLKFEEQTPYRPLFPSICTLPQNEEWEYAKIWYCDAFYRASFFTLILLWSTTPLKEEDLEITSALIQFDLSLRAKEGLP